MERTTEPVSGQRPPLLVLSYVVPHRYAVADILNVPVSDLVYTPRMDFCVGALLPVYSSSKAGVRSSKDLAYTPRTLLLLYEWTCTLALCCLRTAVISAAAPLCSGKARTLY